MAHSQPYNVILLGEIKVGKTTLFKLISGQDLDQWTATHTVKLEDGGNDNVQVTLWDTGGMEKKLDRTQRHMTSMTKSYYRRAVGVILVYDTANLETLNKLKMWIEHAEEYSKWKGHIVYALWGNHTGSYDGTPVEDGSVADFLARQRQTVTSIENEEVNSRTGENVVESFEKLVTTLHREVRSMPNERRSSTVQVGNLAHVQSHGPEQRGGCFSSC